MRYATFDFESFTFEADLPNIIDMNFHKGIDILDQKSLNSIKGDPVITSISSSNIYEIADRRQFFL
jgi:hypothetical protein